MYIALAIGVGFSVVGVLANTQFNCKRKNKTGNV